MKIPYGVADFHGLRTEGQVYVDRTDRIRTLEELGKALLFLRPRRFGKSLWLSVLANYYDLRTAEEHEVLFGGLAMGRRPPAGPGRSRWWNGTSLRCGCSAPALPPSPLQTSRIHPIWGSLCNATRVKKHGAPYVAPSGLGISLGGLVPGVRQTSPQAISCRPQTGSDLATATPEAPFPGPGQGAQAA